jgi:flagellar motor switch protein FliN
MSGEDRNDTTFARETGGGTAVAGDPAPDQALATADLQAVAGGSDNLDLLMDVDMRLTVELGRARLKFREVLNLSAGSVVELPKLTSEDVDIMVNGALLATGEVVVVDDHFAIRITKLLNRVERLKRVL